MIEIDKQPTLSEYGINYGCKNVYSTGPQAECYINCVNNKLECSSMTKLFQPSVILASKAIAFLNGAPEKCSTLGQAPDLTYKYYTRLERPAKDKHSSLLRLFLNYGYRNVCSMGQCCCYLDYPYWADQIEA